MKTLILRPVLLNVLMVMVPVLFFMSNADAQTKKRYEVESGEIVYHTKSPDGTGTKILKFDQYGMREVTRETIEKNGKVVRDMLTILDNEKAYSVDLLNKTGEDMSERINASMQMMQPSDGNYSAMGKDMLKKMGGKMVGHDTFLGKNCEKWNMKMMGDINLLIWNGIVLRSESKIMGMTILEEAQSVKTGMSFPDSEFQPPDGIRINKNEDSPFSGENMGMDDEDMQKIKELQNMSYEDFKKMMKREDPGLSDEEIKQTYEMMKKMGDIFK